MDSNEHYLRCTQCSARNKLPLARLGKNPVCGRCKQKLFSENSPISTGEIIVPCNQCQTSNRIPLQRLGAQPRCGKCKSQLTIRLINQNGPLTLSDLNFSETVLRSPLPFLVNFHSPNCGPCKLLNPSIHKIARDYEGRLKVGMFDVDANQHIPTLYRVGGTPTLLLFQAGKEISRLEGYQPSDTVTQWVGPYSW